ncbi:MAG: hypothetical protein K6B70_01195 [Clostridia bacterium]|nr:hypothetical protein [Clostridia bacterium]
MNKNFLSQIDDLNKEVEDIKKRLKDLAERPDKVVRDSVSGSSTTWPYIKHSCVVEGVDTLKYRNIKKYKRILREKQEKLQKKINQLEYELNYIDDPEIRRIIRYKYVDKLNWVAIMFKMDYNSECQARIKLKRFFEKNSKCTDCTPLT